MMVLLLLCVSALFLFVHLFVFIAGSKPLKVVFEKIVADVRDPVAKGRFLKSILTFGFFKRSCKHLIRYCKLKLFPVTMACLGKKCPDAKLIALDGSVKSLLQHYVDVDPDTPLILNMGSYT